MRGKQQRDFTNSIGVGQRDENEGMLNTGWQNPLASLEALLLTSQEVQSPTMGISHLASDVKTATLNCPFYRNE